MSKRPSVPLFAEDRIEREKMRPPQQTGSQQPIHGGDRYGASLQTHFSQEELLDFSANINPLGMPKSIKEAILKGLSSSAHYPDPFCRLLRAELAKKEGVEAENILCGNGGADLIYRLVYALKPKHALVTAPTFAEYEEALHQAGAQIRHCMLPKSMKLEKDCLQAITDDTDLLFICNPNNPTGLLTGRQLLLEILEKAKTQKTYVCIDECFLDFVREKEAYTITGALAAFPNLLILKSFTKLYAMPGLRLGYILSQNQALLERIRKAGQPWSVSEPAQQAGIAALTETDFRERTLTLVEAERERLETALTKLGLDVWPGKANYLCFRAPGETVLYEKLLEKGILIRRCQNYNGLTKEDYRIAVRTPEENSRLIQAINEVFTNEKA